MFVPSAVQEVRLPDVGVPRRGVTSVGEVANTAEPEPVSSVKAVARLAELGVARNVATPVPKPDTPVAIGSPVALVKVADVGVPRIGVTSVGGGYYAGQIGVSSVATHYLVVGPVASAQSTLQYKNANTATTGADSDIDGPQNTTDIVAGGNSTVYPAAHFCNDLVIGGFSDWYMPAKNELEVCYFNLKPTTTANLTGDGINPNAVPARASNYTSGNPAQTSAADFKSTGAEDFALSYYWSSTDISTLYANSQFFSDGNQGPVYKTYSGPVRAVRRVAV